MNLVLSGNQDAYWENVGSDAERRNPDALWRTEDLVMTITVSEEKKRGLFRCKTKKVFIGQVTSGNICSTGLLTDEDTGEDYCLLDSKWDRNFPPKKPVELEFDTVYFGRHYSLPAIGVHRVKRLSFVHAVQNACQGYVIRYQVPAVVFGAGEFCYPVDYLIVKNGIPQLAVCFCDKNNYRYQRTIQTKQAVEQKGIKYLHFFEEMPNDPFYVTERIRTALEAL